MALCACVFSDNFCVGRQDKRFFYLKCHAITGEKALQISIGLKMTQKSEYLYIFT